MARHTTLTSLFNDIADSIRYVFGESESVKYTADDFDLTIREIPVAKLEETFDVTPTTSQQTILPSGDEYVFSGGIVRAIPTGTIVENEGSISGSTYTQGNVSVNPAGYISTGEKVSGATFANTATASTTYKDISATTAAPVLISNDYLYINKGYTDNVKISLAKLAPDEGSAELASGHILQGYAAYNNDAQLIAGSIPSLT